MAIFQKRTVEPVAESILQMEIMQRKLGTIGTVCGAGNRMPLSCVDLLRWHCWNVFPISHVGHPDTAKLQRCFRVVFERHFSPPDGEQHFIEILGMMRSGAGMSALDERITLMRAFVDDLLQNWKRLNLV